jgi:hypothetical protein
MATQWYYQEAGEERGPVPFRELVELVRAEAISETDLVRSSWKSEWQPAHSVVGLFHMAGRSAAELAQWNSPPTEPVVPEAPTEVAAPDPDDVVERPGWMTRIFTTTRNRQEIPPEIPGARAATAERSATKNVNDAGPVPAAASNPVQEMRPEFSAYYSRPDSATASDAWSSAVEEAVVRADQRAAGLSPSAGRWRRFVRRAAHPLMAMRGMVESQWIRPAFRLFCAIVCANLVALALVEWSAEEDVRFPRPDTRLGQDSGEKYFPIVGRCGTGEFAFLVFDAMLVTGAAGYFAARWLDTRAE